MISSVEKHFFLLLQFQQLITLVLQLDAQFLDSSLELRFFHSCLLLRLSGLEEGLVDAQHFLLHFYYLGHEETLALGQGAPRGFQRGLDQFLVRGLCLFQ